MKKTISTLSLLLMALVFTTSAYAQTVGKPSFVYQKFADYAIAYILSDNGKWALAYGGSTEQMANGQARLINVDTKEVTVIRHFDELDEDAVGEYDVRDVTDDGNIVVGACGGEFTLAGSYIGRPGYWTRSTKTWKTLPMPEGISTAVVISVTPDGKYAVGCGEENADEAFSSTSQGIMWDLTTGKIVELNNVPEMPYVEGTNGSRHKQESFTQITADGRYIVVYGNQSYAPMAYIYDRQTGKSFKFGENSGYDLTKYWELDGEPVLSQNGKYVAGNIRTEDNDIFPMVYNTETGKYTYYNSAEDNDVLIACVDNEGNVYGSSPGTSTPVRDWSVLVGNVWYPFSLVLQQRYGINYEDYTGYSNTGTLWSASADTKRLCSMVSPQGESWIVTLPETIGEACNSINLLDSFTPTPAAGSDFSNVAVIKATFTHDIAAIGDRNCALLKDKDGNVVKQSIGFAVDQTNPKVLVVTFRSTQMNEGENYTVEIPAGTVALSKATDKTNNILTIGYKGRANVPVKLQTTFPENNAELARIDNSSNPVYMTFDTNVLVDDDAKAELVQIDGDKEKTICSLTVVASGNSIALLPAASQFLYKGYNYKVVLEAGAVTDVSGSAKSANEEITLNFVGSYERQISTSDATLFSQDFNDVSQALKDFMRYEGDHLTPVSSMTAWGFDADNQPWNFSVKESSSSSDYCAVATSMYTTNGQADDWMVIPQLTIPDAYCSLSFDAQSYQEDKKDILKVVVWECDRNINDLSAEDIAAMKADGDITEYELNIGDTEDGIEGEFTHYTLDLGKYAGKKVYIGFWNNNTNQSAIFVDNIEVKRNMKYLMSLSTASTVANKNEVKIAGSLRINTSDETFSSVHLTLKDAQGNVVDNFDKTGLTLKKYSRVAFEFEKPLPLTIGEKNDYSIEVKLDDYTDVTNNSIKDLTFEPVKRVVLEECTGTTCVNCPQGILAIENMKKIFGEQFIPVSLHTYTGDPYGTGLYGYADFLGLSAAPTGIVQRDGVISHPLGQDDDGNYLFSNGGSQLWQDKVSKELDEPTELGVSVPRITLDENTNKLNIDLQIQAAMNLKNQYLNVFAVALEDGILATQVNNLYTQTDPIFGEWGKGGKYGYASVSKVPQEDMVRGYWGTSYSGSNVGFPQALKAGEVYSTNLSLSYPDQISDRNNGKIVLMVFDGNTNKLVNSVLVKLNTIGTGIDNAIADNGGSDCDITAAGGVVSVKVDGYAKVEIYNVAGTLINTASGTNNISVASRGYHGAAIVKVTTDNSCTTKKIVL